MEIECVGKKSGDGQILLDPSLINRAKIGSTIKLKIIVPEQKEKKGKKQMDAATQRFLSRLENAPKLGRIKGNLSREDIYEDMADERF
jgi:hypothetical protein